MKRLILLTVTAAMLASPQPEPRDPRERRMHDGRTQADHILEDDYKKSIADTEEMNRLAAELLDELQENDYNVFSIQALRKAERIEELAKRVKKRLKRY
jgi:hypothetical protein